MTGIFRENVPSFTIPMNELNIQYMEAVCVMRVKFARKLIAYIELARRFLRSSGRKRSMELQAPGGAVRSSPSLGQSASFDSVCHSESLTPCQVQSPRLLALSATPRRAMFGPIRAVPSGLSHPGCTLRAIPTGLSLTGYPIRAGPLALPSGPPHLDCLIRVVPYGLSHPDSPIWATPSGLSHPGCTLRPHPFGLHLTGYPNRAVPYGLSHPGWTILALPSGLPHGLSHPGLSPPASPIRAAPYGLSQPGCSLRSIPSGLDHLDCPIRAVPSGLSHPDCTVPTGCPIRAVPPGLSHSGCPIRSVPSGPCLARCRRISSEAPASSLAESPRIWCANSVDAERWEGSSSSLTWRKARNKAGKPQEIALPLIRSLEGNSFSSE